MASALLACGRQLSCALGGLSLGHQALGAIGGAFRRHASSHAENTNTFLREVIIQNATRMVRGTLGRYIPRGEWGSLAEARRANHPHNPFVVAWTSSPGGLIIERDLVKAVPVLQPSCSRPYNHPYRPACNTSRRL